VFNNVQNPVNTQELAHSKCYLKKKIETKQPSLHA